MHLQIIATTINLTNIENDKLLPKPGFEIQESGFNKLQYIWLLMFFLILSLQNVLDNNYYVEYHNEFNKWNTATPVHVLY